MAASSETRRLVALLGAMKRHHPAADTGRIEADLKASQLLDRIRKDVATAPPIPVDVRHELAALLLRQPASGSPPGRDRQSATGGSTSAEAGDAA